MDNKTAQLETGHQASTADCSTVISDAVAFWWCLIGVGLLGVIFGMSLAVVLLSKTAPEKKIKALSDENRELRMENQSLTIKLARKILQERNQ